MGESRLCGSNSNMSHGHTCFQGSTSSPGNYFARRDKKGKLLVMLRNPLTAACLQNKTLTTKHHHISIMQLPFTLLLTLTGLAAHAQMSQCARDYVIDWCQPICGDHLECRLPCMEDCKDSCIVCENEHNCPDQLPDVTHIVLSGSPGTTEKDLWVKGAKETGDDGASGVVKTTVVPKFERSNEALWREHHVVAKKQVRRRVSFLPTRFQDMWLLTREQKASPESSLDIISYLTSTTQ